MQILSLELTNAKSYNHAHITFADGVNVIVGHNGAGKSTILEAIGFVLFDALEYKQEEFVREGADSAELAVTFASSLDGRPYQVTRRCGSSTHYRVFDPQLQAKLHEGKADVQRFMRQHMGVDSAFDLAVLFRDAVGVPQGTFTAVFLEPVAKRKITFDRLLRVEEYSKAAERLREPARTLNERKQKLEVQLAALAARLEQLPRLQAAIEQRCAQMTLATAQLAETQQRLTLLQTQRVSLEALQQQVITLRNHYQQKTQQVQTLETQLRAAEVAQQGAVRARRAVQENVAGYERYTTAQNRQKGLDVQMRQRQSLEKQRADLDKALVQSQTEWKLTLRELESVAAAEEQLTALKTALQQQESLESALLEAQRASARLEDAHQQAARHEQEMRRLHGKASDLAAQLARAAALEEQSQGAQARLLVLRSEIDDCKDALAQVRSAANLLKKQNETLQEITTATCPVCAQPLTAEHRTQVMTQNEQQLALLRLEYKRQSDQVKMLEDALKAQDANLQMLQQQMLRLPRPEELAQVRNEVAVVEEMLHAAQSQVEQLLAAPHQVETLNQQLAALGDPKRQHAVAAATTQRRPQLEAQQARLQKGLSTVQQQLDQCIEKLAHFAGLDAALEAVQVELQQNERAYQIVLTNQQVAETVETRVAEVTELRTLHTMAQEELQQAQKELLDLEARFDRDELQRILAEEQQLTGQLGGLHTALTLLRRDQERDEAALRELQRQQAELGQVEAQKQTIDSQANTLDAMRDLLRRAGPQVTKALIQQVSSSAGQIFCDIMQDYTRHLIWKEDYGIAVEVSGYERQFAQLSGGEQMSAALALRLALLREMSAIDIAFFDEPTTNLDETRRDSLVRQILEVKGFRQLFVISHDDAFEQATQNLIRVQRINGVSKILDAR